MCKDLLNRIPCDARKQRGTFVFVAAQIKILLKQVVHNVRYLTSQSNQNRVNILNLNGP